MMDFLFPVGQLSLFCVGLALAMHIFYAAELLGKAPHYLKALLMPVTVASGVMMMWAGVWGNFVIGGVAAMIGCAGSTGIMLSAWASGAYISRTFQQMADLKAMNQRQIYDLYAATDGLVTESGFKELVAQEARRKKCIES